MRGRDRGKDRVTAVRVILQKITAPQDLKSDEISRSAQERWARPVGFVGAAAGGRPCDGAQPRTAATHGRPRRILLANSKVAPTSWSATPVGRRPLANC